jgi:hypothetical protein
MATRAACAVVGRLRRLRPGARWRTRPHVRRLCDSRAPASGGSAIPRPKPAPSAKAKAPARPASAPAGSAPASATPRRGPTGDSLHIPEAPGALTPAAAGRLGTVQAGNQGNAAATTTLPSGQQQTDVGRAAVEEPQAEQDARAQHGVVTDVDDRPPPSPEIEEGVRASAQVIRDKRPPRRGQARRGQAARDGRGGRQPDVGRCSGSARGTRAPRATPTCSSPAPLPEQRARSTGALPHARRGASGRRRRRRRPIR